MDHQVTDHVVHAVDRWSTVILGLATTVAAVWVTLSKAIGPYLQRRRAMASVEKRNVSEWMQGRIAQLERDLDAARAETTEWQRKWSDEVHERARDAEKFLRALDGKRTASSAPPPTSR